jgi:hypothetical protein
MVDSNGCFLMKYLRLTAIYDDSYTPNQVVALLNDFTGLPLRKVMLERRTIKINEFLYPVDLIQGDWFTVSTVSILHHPVQENQML